MIEKKWKIFKFYNRNKAPFRQGVIFVVKEVSFDKRDFLFAQYNRNIYTFLKSIYNNSNKNKFFPYFNNPLLLSFYVCECNRLESIRIIDKLNRNYKMVFALPTYENYAPRWRLEEDYCLNDSEIGLPLKAYEK